MHAHMFSGDHEQHAVRCHQCAPDRSWQTQVSANKKREEKKEKRNKRRRTTWEEKEQGSICTDTILKKHHTGDLQQVAMKDVGSALTSLTTLIADPLST